MRSKTGQDTLRDGNTRTRGNFGFILFFYSCTRIAVNVGADRCGSHAVIYDNRHGKRVRWTRRSVSTTVATISFARVPPWSREIKRLNCVLPTLNDRTRAHVCARPTVSAFLTFWAENEDLRRFRSVQGDSRRSVCATLAADSLSIRIIFSLLPRIRFSISKTGDCTFLACETAAWTCAYSRS